MDDLDRAAIEEMRERERAITNQKEMQACLKTAQCFDDDGFVVCCECDDRISRQRQNAVAQVRLCIVCQAHNERAK